MNQFVNIASEHDLSGIEEFLRTCFKKAPLSFLAKLAGEPAEYDYRILAVDPHDCNKDFRAVELVWIEVGEPFLDFALLPGPRSRGLFALNDSGCWYLHSSRPEGVQQLLSAEEDIAALPPASLAKVFCDAVLSTKNIRHRLLESFSQLEAICLCPQGKYALEPGEAEKIRAEIVPANIAESSETGEYVLRFATLSGWMHEAKQINRVTVKVAVDRSVSCVDELTHRPHFFEHAAPANLSGV